MLVAGFAGATRSIWRHAVRKVVVKKMWGLPRRSIWSMRARAVAIREMVVGGHIESAHDLSDGGLAVALAECCAGGWERAIEVPDLV